MTLQRVRTDWFTRRRYIAYVLVVSMTGGLIMGYLLGVEHTIPGVTVGGLTAALVAIPRVVASRPLFDERDYRLDDRAARYTIYVVTATGLLGLVGPIVVEQLGIAPFQGWALVVGLVCMGIVYLYVGISLVLRYRA